MASLKAVIEMKECKDCDKVAVVRCRDCKHFRMVQRGKKLVAVCYHDDWYVDCDSPYTEEDGYCFRSERKNEVNE